MSFGDCHLSIRDLVPKDPNFLKYVGNRLREIRKAKGFTGESVRKLLGYTRPVQWMDIETGKQCITLLNAKKFCILFRCRLDDLVPARVPREIPGPQEDYLLLEEKKWNRRPPPKTGGRREMNSELRQWIIKLGESIRRLRLRKRIRSTDIAKAIGRPLVRYVEMENGHRGAYNYLPEIARYLGVPLKYFDKYWPPRGRVQNWLHMFVYRPEARAYLTEHIKKLPLKK